jgi:hypothetical protein
MILTIGSEESEDNREFGHHDNNECEVEDEKSFKNLCVERLVIKKMHKGSAL